MENHDQVTTGTVKRRVKLYERGPHDDIKFRGPLSYRAFQIVGWICLVVTQSIILVTLAGKANTATATHYIRMADTMSYIGAMALPFLLLASFANMLNHDTSYQAQLLKNFGIMVALAAVFYVVIYHFVFGTLNILDPDKARAWRFLENEFYSEGPGFLKFNVFVDLFLCTLFLFFLCYQPKKLFQGKWVILLRLGVLLPVAYEIFCMALKWYSAKGQIHIPVAMFPFLTVKPPMTFIVFIVLSFYVKHRERVFLKHGKTYEEYRAFMGTNRNSLHFSIFAAVLLLVAGLLDYFLFAAIADHEIRLVGGIQHITAEQVNAISALGFGDAIQLALMAPVVLLFSYNRTHKNKLIDLLIPVVGVVAILIVFLQGSFQILKIMNLPKINLDEITETVNKLNIAIKSLSTK